VVWGLGWGESNSVTPVAMGNCWFGVPLYRTTRKVVGCMGDVEYVGSFFALLPPAVAGGVGSIGVSGVGSIGARGVLGVRTGIVMGSPACGRGTISGGCKYHTGIANTIFGSVSVAAT
jgi:hypothetical protein